MNDMCDTPDRAFGKALRRIARPDAAIGAVQTTGAVDDRFAVAVVIRHFREIWPDMVQAAIDGRKEG